MAIPFKYGSTYLDLTIPDSIRSTTHRAPNIAKLLSPIDAIIEACENPYMSPPLSQILESFQKKLHVADDYICIVISDHTRPVPSHQILTALDRILQKTSIPDIRVKILIANGLHQKTTPKELKAMLGIDFLTRFDIINHDAHDLQNLIYIGENSFQSSIYLNSVYLDAKIKIITGYVEPHFFAGFSGGRKSIVPGISGKDTIMQNHSASKINNDNSRFGKLKDNPIYEDAQATLKLPEVKPDFLINVCINEHHEIIKVAGGSIAAHDILVQYQNQHAFFPIKKRYDVVICGNGGYPLDQNLYQAVKSIAIGEIAVKPNGTIIAINKCQNGIGDENFKKILHSGLNPQRITHEILTRKTNSSEHWQMQILARILAKTDIIIISDLKEDQLGNIGLIYKESFSDALNFCKKKHGETFDILILPDGPSAIPKYHHEV